MPMPISFLNNIYRYVVFARIRGSDISVTETITETEIIDPTLTETETETMGFVETDIM